MARHDGSFGPAHVLYGQNQPSQIYMVQVLSSVIETLCGPNKIITFCFNTLGCYVHCSDRTVILSELLQLWPWNLASGIMEPTSCWRILHKRSECKISSKEMEKKLLSVFFYYWYLSCPVGIGPSSHPLLSNTCLLLRWKKEVDDTTGAWRIGPIRRLSCWYVWI